MSANLIFLLKEKSPIPLSKKEIETLDWFFERVVQENQIQNLTRITEPSSFFWDQIYDCLVLKKLGWLDSEPVLDIGPGAGVPGLVLATLGVSGVQMVETEKKKADFIGRVLLELDIKAKITWGRAENEVGHIRPAIVIAKAVGPLGRIYGWTQSCSTWNKTVLFKGPSWSTEWSNTPEKVQKAFRAPQICQYSTPEKSRNLILLSRVPRGTR
jgi:16S rRNA (guanine(527)-N(7))-methyltransferase RsmG